MGRRAAAAAAVAPRRATADSTVPWLRVGAWALACASVGCFALLDEAMPGAHHGEARLIGVSLGVLFAAWSAPLALLGGVRRFGYAQFQVYQPFRGGTTFVAMQALGWSLFSVCVALQLLVLANCHDASVFRRGELLAVGLLGFAGNALINLSVDVFQPDGAAGRTGQRPSSPRKRVARNQSFKAIVCCSIAALDFVALAAIDWLGGGVRRDLFVRFCALVFVICVGTVHGVCGAVELRGAGYRTFMPFQGRQDFQLLQAIGWTLFGLTMFAFVNDRRSGLLGARGALAMAGACGFTATGLLALSVVRFRPMAGRGRAAEMRGGVPALLYYICAAQATVGSVLFCTGWAIPGSPRGSAQSAALLLVGPPLAHVACWLRLRDQGLWLVKPLSGGLSFILAQASGWTLFGLLVHAVLLRGLRPAPDTIFLEPLAVVSQALLLSSARVFEAAAPAVKKRRSNSGPPQTSGTSAAKAETASGTTRALSSSSSSSSSSMQLADATTVASFACAVLVDARLLADGSAAVRASTRLALEVSLALSVLSRLGAYAATFGERLPSWRPFRGPEEFVMCEATSWTLYAVAVVADFVILNALRTDDEALLAATRGWATAIGVGHAFSQLLLRFGCRILLHVDAPERPPRESPARLVAGMSRPFTHAAATAALVLCGYADWHRTPVTSGSEAAFHAGVCAGVVGAVLAQAWVGPRSRPEFRAFQPFRGGARFVLLQAIAWTLFGVALTLALVCANVGPGRISFSGILTGLGAAFFASVEILMGSLAFFRARLGSQGEAEWGRETDGRIGLVLGSVALVLFAFTDFAVIRFGLSERFVRPVVACAWVAACGSVPLSAYVLFRAQEARRRAAGDGARRGVSSLGLAAFLEGVQSPTLVLLGCALWTFTLLLGALLLVHNVLHSEYIPRMWAATLAGCSSVLSHLVFKLATVSSGRELATMLPMALVTSVVVWVGVRVFCNVILPLLRLFLDYPMHRYAVVQKRVEGWVSPDGIQALKNVHLERGLQYGPGPKHLLDRMRPLDMLAAHSSCAGKANEGGAVLYCHGGGHLCVTSEILLHSMTPLCRAGLTVYSVEYPLSPDARYPEAVLCLLRAMQWVKRNHCGNIECRARCSRERVSPLNAHECDSSCDTFRDAEDKVVGRCVHCGGKLGCDKVQLIGDSAGGSLVAMAAALACNPPLLAEALQLGGDAFSDLSLCDPKSLPTVSRLCAMYGLLGRQTPLANPPPPEKAGSWLWNAVCHIGISFIFLLYDPERGTSKSDDHGSGGKAEPVRSTLTDFPVEALRNFPDETMLICGASDPLLPSNERAAEMLVAAGHSCKLHVLPGTHAFHGFPVNWMHYLGADWRTNALPATMLLLRFMTGDCLDEEALLRAQRAQLVVPDYSPLVVFPAFFFALPAVAVWAIVKAAGGDEH